VNYLLAGRFVSYRQTLLFHIARALLAIALTGECFLRATLFAGLQIERMALDLFNDIFLLDLALEAAERALQGFPILKNDFSQA
jgi:hypothetical protein